MYDDVCVCSMSARSIATQPAQARRVKPLGLHATASGPLESSSVRRRRPQCVIHAITEREVEYLSEAVSLATRSVTLTEPHPNSACLLVSESNEVFRGALWAQGCESGEVQAARVASGRAKGGTAFLNLECGDCDGDDAAVRALIDSGVARCVIGMPHPLPHFRGKAISALKDAGIDVELAAGNVDSSVLRKVHEANEGLIHLAANDRPMGILKYAMTMDGKIAATSGHSAWVSSKDSRQIVFDTRASVNAVIVGGQTVRRDNPQLTTRRDEGWQPVRVVMSRTLDLPRDAAMWDISVATTIVATQRGANRPMQEFLTNKGVQVVEFDFLTPEVVSKYCRQRGFLSLLWECGGALAAPAVSDSVVHKVMAFIAPKIIGGSRAPTPMGDLGFVEMTQAIPVVDYAWKQVGPDICMTGYFSDLAALAGAPSNVSKTGDVVSFFKAWDRNGILSNFSPHPISVESEVYATVEHWYQSQKLAGVSDEISTRVKNAISPEEAAIIGRRAEREGKIRSDWADVKLTVMETGLRAKFGPDGPARRALIATGSKQIVESSPHDYFWGCGWNRTGANWLGLLLMKIRDGT
jgi:diaminohydroxyphosphoribosylaminopyrimidine deaminase/5-amino-6-(5-phosphoribosylamino)uracil reductase